MSEHRNSNLEITIRRSNRLSFAAAKLVVKHCVNKPSWGEINSNHKHNSKPEIEKAVLQVTATSLLKVFDRLFYWSVVLL